MAIQTVESFTKRNVGIVRVTTDDGDVGYGQFSPYNADITAQVFHRQVAPYALGADEEGIEALVDRVMEGTYKFPGSYVCRALTGLDTALWDLRGRRQGAPVCELLGGSPDPVRAYGSSMRRDIEPEAEAERLVELRDEQGFDAFKIRVGSVTGHDRDQWPGRTEELVPTVREAVGEDVDLLVDGNSCYTAERAIEVGREVLEPNGVCHFEEPCPYWEVEWTAEVREALDVPVAGGEQDNDLTRWRRIVDLPAVDVVQPDVCYIGGLTRTLRVAEMAAEADLPVVPHSANHSMVTVFSLHLLAAIENAGPYLEFSIEPQWSEGLLDHEYEVADGHVAVPDGPGWGVEPTDEWLATADYEVTE